jgi:hypothetical protein
MTDQKQEAGTLTLGERMVLAARLAVMEHLRQSVTAVPSDSSYFSLTDFSDSSGDAAGEFLPYDDEAEYAADLEAELPELVRTSESIHTVVAGELVEAA